MPIGEWDHNRWYHGRLLRHVPDGAQRVLEVGCGAGTLARRLAATVPHVDAIDRSPEMLAAAAQGAPANLHLRLDDVLTADLPAEAYDAVLSLSVLHHLPLREALKRMAGALKPGGVLIAVALPRPDLPRELPVEAAASLGRHAMGFVFAACGRLTGRRPFAHERTHDGMPVQDGDLTVRQVRRAAAELLPGVRVRRLLFWRYLLLWRRPS